MASANNSAKSTYSDQPSNVQEGNWQAWWKAKEEKEGACGGPTVNYYDPRRPSDRGVDFERLQQFKASLGKSSLSCGWLLQLKTATSETNSQEDQVQFPLTKTELDRACSKVLEMLAISDEVAIDLEEQTRGQSSSVVWHQSRAGRITASNFGCVCKCTWFKSRDIARIQSLIKDLISPTHFTNPPAPIKWGIDCEPQAAACYVELQGVQGNDCIQVNECGLFLPTAFMIHLLT